MKRGFTIVELLSVVGVIAILLTIVITAAAGAIKNARERRAETMRVALEQGLNAYYAQNDGEWPDTIEDAPESTGDTVTFSGTQADEIFREVVGSGFGKSKKGKKSMLVDASGLMVCSSTRAGDPNAMGLDFSVAANRNGRDYIPFASMSFGYPESSRGRFRRYKVVYNLKTDSVKVTK